MAGSGGHGGDAGGMEWKKMSGKMEGDRGQQEGRKSQERAEKCGHQVRHIKRAGAGRVWKKGLFHTLERRKKLGFLRKELTGHQLSWSGRGHEMRTIPAGRQSAFRADRSRSITATGRNVGS